ncbi:hypothetical protein LNV23_23710 [Paucibacter sp. DJ1R-11]|uniref:hypothetical protein n=1 Tax=Paucibacter sp. DJ1R-11 TaxID=2893556 RepID=UPI0021E486A0|nr:hypothetical protein [Paucibacter sp. DJ1R-11]MCV2366443.1 hypothetical protein [Paucibacter sp. DJ1R-11]
MFVTFPILKKREELSRVRFDAADCRQYIDELLIEAPHLAPDLESLRSQLKAPKSSVDGDASVELIARTPLDERRMEWMAAELLQHEKGSVRCAKCQRELKAAGSVFERYERGRGRLDGGGGRRFYCGLQLHMLLEVVDWRS